MAKMKKAVKGQTEIKTKGCKRDQNKKLNCCYKDH